MSPGVTPARPAAGLTGRASGGAGPRPVIPRLRVAALAAGAVGLLAAIVLVSWALAAARVPQHRAALEQLIRRETGLDVRFRELTIRWGWYGPEAVFRPVELGEAAGGRTLLRAAQLVIGLDSWGMLRSGRLEVGRLTLVDADIDLGAAVAGLAAGNTTRALEAAGADAARKPDAQAAALRALSGWRGGRIEIQGGTLRTPLAGAAAPALFGIRHAQLRRLGARWSAEAQLILPARLGASARLTLELTGDPAQRPLGDATLSFDGQRLELAGWRALGAGFLPALVPDSGSGNLELRATFAHGDLVQADGRLRAQALAWSTPATLVPAFSLPRVRAGWRLSRRGSEWHFSADSLALDDGQGATASLELVAASDGTYARGRARHVPLGALSAAAGEYAPPVPRGLALGGEARELSFDWNAARPAGERLETAAQLEGLSISTTTGELRLSGLRGHASGSGGQVLADVSAHDARLAILRTEPLEIAGMEFAARLEIAAGADGRWRLATEALHVQSPQFTLTANGELVAADASNPPRINAQIALTDVDAALLARALGAPALAALGAVPAQLTAGRIENADLHLRGPLEEGAPWNWEQRGGEFRGELDLRSARLTGTAPFPETRDLDARVQWRGARLHATFERARSGSFEIAAGSADWDARGTRPVHLVARASGAAQEALAWLREHPEVGSFSPALQTLQLGGTARLDADITLPAALPLDAGAHPMPATRVTATLEDAQLRPLAGLPAIEALRGKLAFAGGRLQRSTLTGQWLGGPVALAVSEHSERGAAAIGIAGRGVLEVRAALAAAGADANDARLAGSAEWNALVNLTGGDTAWRLSADSSLVGVASGLPEPFAKSAGLALPLHLELACSASQGELQIALADRLRARAALKRSGEAWRIERGAVRLGATAPILPGGSVVELDGRIGRLELPAYLALWREAGRDAALPALRARLLANEVYAGSRSYADVRVAAEAAAGSGRLQVDSAELSGTLSWNELGGAAQPAQAYLARYDLAGQGDAALVAALATQLAPGARLTVGDLRWQGRALGRLDAVLGGVGDVLEMRDARLAGAAGEARAAARCDPRACRAELTLESADAAATLASLGLEPELTAGHAALRGELQWPTAGASLASLVGHLHMQLEDGVVRPAGTERAGVRPPGTGRSGVPFALASVPALIAGLGPDARPQAEAGLPFSRLSADFELRQGEARTANLHLDGDAEILVRGRVGLVEQDYDEQAWILHGEERLPAALRRLGPTPRVAALWLSLRELFGVQPGARARELLLRGTWSNPVVTAAE